MASLRNLKTSEGKTFLLRKLRESFSQIASLKAGLFTVDPVAKKIIESLSEMQRDKEQG